MPFSQQTSGLIYGLFAYLLWGTFPIFFHWIDQVPPIETLSHRIIWSFVFVSCLLLLPGKFYQLKHVLAQPKIWKGLLLSSLLISTNWLAFIWTITQGDILASSLGYFITPLVSVLLARIFLQERLQTFQAIACMLAVCAVIWQVISHNQLPIISLILAFSFGLYGLVRKQQKADPVTGLLLEAAILLPIALLYVSYLTGTQSGYFIYGGFDVSSLLIISGVMTAIPLLAFAAGARRLPLSTIGFLLYINPTIQFVIAVFMYDEHFDQNSLITFALIWVALGLFIWGSFKQNQARRTILVPAPIEKDLL